MIEPSPSRTLRNNNFDMLRFLLSSIVFLFHAYVLSGEQALKFLSRWLSAEMAVHAFFVVSGFLILMSYEHSTDLKGYFEKRARRIYPAYVAVVLLSIAITAHACVFFTGYNEIRTC